MHQLSGEFPMSDSALFRHVRSQDGFFLKDPKSCSSPQSLVQRVLGKTAGVAEDLGALLHPRCLQGLLSVSAALRPSVSDSLWFPTGTVPQLEAQCERCLPNGQPPAET